MHKDKSIEFLNSKYYDLIDQCKALDHRINDLKKNTQLSSINRQELNKLISKRKCLHKELNNTLNLYSTRSQLNRLKLEEVIHNRFHWLFNIHKQLAYRFCSLNKERRVGEILKEKLVYLLIDFYSLFNGSISRTFTKFKLYLRMFYFKIQLIIANHMLDQ